MFIAWPPAVSAGRAVTGSNPPQQRTVRIPYLDTTFGKSQLSEPDSSDLAHVSKETNKWLAAQREGRFSFVFTPKHASWLNLVEGFFSKMARSVLRRIRVASKAELKQRILAYLDDLNREPVVHTWSYRITLPA